jgi:hypothetical protein
MNTAEHHVRIAISTHHFVRLEHPEVFTTPSETSLYFISNTNTTASPYQLVAPR